MGRHFTEDASVPLSPCLPLSLSLFLSVSVGTYLTEAAIARGVIAPRSITAPFLAMV
jgi:hypothetical protein